MQLRVSEGKPQLEEEETGPGTKLGIVKLGKVAGKVSDGYRYMVTIPANPVQSRPWIYILAEISY